MLSDCLQPRAQWHWLRAMPWVPIGYCDPDYGSRNSNSDPDVIITDKRCCTSEPRRLMRLQRVHDRRCRVPGWNPAPQVERIKFYAYPLRLRTGPAVEVPTR